MYKEFIQKLTEIVEANLANEKFDIEDLAKEMGMSHSNLHRKLKTALNQNISQFIREARLKKAKELLLNEELTISEISYGVGFGSPNYFTKCFHAYFRISPGELRSIELQENASIEEPDKETLASNKKRQKPFLLLTSIVVVISAIILIIVFKPFSWKQKSKELTIAVLPFVDYSPEQGNSYIINGLGDEILDKLEKIKDLKVKSRTDVEQFRDSKQDIKEIAKELKVNYVLEGSGQTINGKTRLRLQLIETKSGNHLWSKSFEEVLNKDNIFDIQEDVALSVAKEMQAIITPEEKELVTKKPTKNLTAYYLYIRGLDYLKLVEYKKEYEKQQEELQKAKKLLEEAIKLDTTFVDAYLKLGFIYNEYLLYNDINLAEKTRDSALIMANKVLLINDKIPDAYDLKAHYYLYTGMLKEADEAYLKLKALTNGNELKIHLIDFWKFAVLRDYYNAIISFYKFTDCNPSEEELFPTYRVVQNHFNLMGYPEMAKKYSKKLLEKTNDSVQYYYYMFNAEEGVGNFETAVEYGLKAEKIDSTLESNYVLVTGYLLLRDYSKAYEYLLKTEKKPYNLGVRYMVDYISAAGYLYLKYGQTEKANICFENVLKFCLDEIKYNRVHAQNFYSQQDMAAIYAARGEKEKAIKNLELLKRRTTNPAILLTFLKYWPLYDNIRSEPEFATILIDVETKYEKAHLEIGELIKKKNFTIEQ